MSDHYLRFPLALLRTTTDEVNFFESAANFAAVNAGYGFRENHQECGFQSKLEEVFKEDADEEAIVGASIIKISLADKSGHQAKRVYDDVVAACQGSPLVTMKSEFFWNACNTARVTAGKHRNQPDKRISWREFRVLCAVYSLAWNNRGFCFAGLEFLKCRASGFHNKKGFITFEFSDDSWPDHCLPMTERQIGVTVDRLEELGFFLRCRIGSGTRGGLTAYSIRHKTRELLMRDCVEWRALNQRATIQDNRREDRDLYAKMTTAVKERTVRLERKYSPKKPKNGLQSGINTHSVKVPVQVGVQHKEKCSEKCSEKSEGTPPAGGVGVFFKKEGMDQAEEGYLYQGDFISSAEVNSFASRLVVANPDKGGEIFKEFKSARRFTAHDGSIRIEEAA